MKKILFLVVIAVLSFPFLSYAATYQYIDTTGELKAVEPSTAEEAMPLANTFIAFSVLHYPDC